MPPRRTISDAIRITGTGLFTGAPCSVTLEPAGAGTRYAIRAGGATFKACSTHRSSHAPHPAFAAMPPRNTALAARPSDAASPAVQTVEHLLAAFAGLGVTDVLATIEGPEVPIGDGSAKLFTGPITDIGLRELAEDASALVVTSEASITTEDGQSSMLIEPSADGGTHFRYELDYGPDAPVKPRVAEWHGDPDDFAARIAPARTFSLQREVEAMRSMGLFTAFKPSDLLVIADNGEPIDNTLHTPDEPALHKLLDLIGDLALFTGGRPLAATITATRSGHKLNHAAADALENITA
ncbi:MAG: UDP-3-O-acyl-N-acetylglucosamine deacetylase [Planctomycetota bacterium]